VSPIVNAVSGRLRPRPPQRAALEVPARIVELARPAKGTDVGAAREAVRGAFRPSPPSRVENATARGLEDAARAAERQRRSRRYGNTGKTLARSPLEDGGARSAGRVRGARHVDHLGRSPGLDARGAPADP